MAVIFIIVRKRSCGKVFFTGVCLSGRGSWVSLVPCPFRGWVGMFRGVLTASPGGVGTHPPRYRGHGILRDIVDKRVVRILVECFLIENALYLKAYFQYKMLTSFLFLFSFGFLKFALLSLQAGIATVQLALGHGCTVLGTAGTQEGMDLVKSQGAHAVFNHREPGYVDKIQVILRIFFTVSNVVAAR